MSTASIPPPSSSPNTTSPVMTPKSPEFPASAAFPPTQQAGVLDAVRTIKPADFTTFHQAPCARESLLTGIGAGFAIGGLRFVVLSRTANATSSRATSTTATTPTSAARRTNIEHITSKIQPLNKSGGIGGITSQSRTGAAAASSPVIPEAQSTAQSLRKPASSIPSEALRRQKINSLSGRAWRSMTWAVLSFTLVSAGTHVFCQRRRKLEKAAMARATEIVNRKRAEKRAEMVKRKEIRDSKRVEHEKEKSERSRWGRWFGTGGGAAGTDVGKDPGGQA